MEKILLRDKKSVNSLKEDSYLGVSFKTTKMLLPSTSIDESINQTEVYNDERNKSNKIRLICSINPLCSNVLFNNFTEIVFNEGSDNPILNRYHKFIIPAASLAENSKTRVRTSSRTYNDKTCDAIKDTQLSQYDNFTYHCGLDFFNNHLLRSKTFKSVVVPNNATNYNPNNDKSVEIFNTIRDILRDLDGNKIQAYKDNIVNNQYQQSLNPDIQYLHLYTTDDIYSFHETIDEKLTEKNGWLGFVNTPKLSTYDNNDKAININKPINNAEPCGFIDMYPDRELYFFTPKYNKSRHRMEKNWNYCLTYPSSSTTENIPFINSTDGLNSIVIGVFDDNVKNSQGVSSILIYSTCKHGLNERDTINLYLTKNKYNQLIIDGVFVNEVVDEYTFYIDRDVSLSENWVNDDDDILQEYKLVNKCVYQKDGKYFPIINGRVNLNEDNCNYSFKKVVNGTECQYYVRIFAKLPNWKFTDIEPTEFEIYQNKENNNDLLFRHQQLNKEFESHIGKVGFSTNIYGDDVDEIVFTDDIDLSNLRDNLNRPLTSIYLTILKNNRGYKDWYYKGDTRNDINFSENDIISEKPNTETGDIFKKNDTLEYSHCFGKLSSSFKLSWRSLINPLINNTVRINNLKSENSKVSSCGLDMSKINPNNRPKNVDKDEVIYRYYDENDKKSNLSGDTFFYGDVVCFSPIDFTETSLQMSDFRFNTAQRELQEGSFFNASHGDSILFEEIEYDDYDLTSQNFNIIEKDIKNVLGHREGYYYTSHYEIPIHTFSNEVVMANPRFYSPQSLVTEEKNGETLYLVKTLEKTYLELYDKFILYDLSYDNNDEMNDVPIEYKFHYMEVVEIKNRRIIVAKETNTTDEKLLKYNISHQFKMFHIDESFADYAYLIKDGNLKLHYTWREIIRNGKEDVDGVESYPFTNGALYVNKFINFYLKRQDPNNYVKDYAWDGHLSTMKAMYDVEMKSLDVNNENNYKEEGDIVC